MSDPTPAQIAALVKKCQKGDDVASAELIRHHQERLLRFCIYLCGDRSLAQDLAQDAFVRALTNIRKLRDPAGFQSWLLRTAKNLFLDHVKSPRNQATDEIAPEGDSSSPPAELHENPNLDVSLQVRNVLGKMSSDDRALLLLIDMEGRSYAEAAEIIGISEANIRFKLHHVRKAFLKLYQQ